MQTQEILPQWDNSTEYKGFQADDFKSDVQYVESGIKQIKSIINDFKSSFSKVNEPAEEKFVKVLQDIIGLNTDVSKILYNLHVFTSCERSLDATNAEATKTESTLNVLKADLEANLNPLTLFISRTTDENFEKVMNSEKTKSYLFSYKTMRTQKDFLLSESEENLISRLKANGHGSWGDLYMAISGTAKVEITLNGKTESYGVAQASAMTRNSDEPTRKAAWEALQKTWTTHKQSAAMILNSLAGWRHEINKNRSHTKATDFLDQPLYNSRIKSETLNAMMDAISENRLAVQVAAKNMAKLMGKKQLDPWDLLAPAPIQSSSHVSFNDGFEQIRNSFAAVDGKMGEFAQMMLDKNWIDARVLPNKANGAFCTGFAKTNSPRVFQTYMGSSQDVSTLAHELGHGYHSWVMRDMPMIEQEYPMTLAETASIFAENVLFDYQISHAKTKDEKLDVLWSLTEGAVSLLLNIPTRFEFEKNFYEKRKQGFVSADELSELMQAAYTHWYGDSISVPDKMFWATKLHFAISEVSFYNFPYSFGYLFSLSIYARKNELGANFSKKYIEILRDTGIMSAEDLIQKHLGEDITKKEFWQKSINVVLAQINEFNKL